MKRGKIHFEMHVKVALTIWCRQGASANVKMNYNIPPDEELFSCATVSEIEMCTTHVVKLIPNMAHFTSLRGNKDAEMPISLYCCATAKQRRAQILQLVSQPFTAKCSTWHSLCHFLHNAIFHQTKNIGPAKGMNFCIS